MGVFILITNNLKMDAVGLLDLYRKKDAVEKCFNTIKNELDLNRMRVHSDTTCEGKMFMTFLAAILYTALSNQMKEADLFKKYTLHEIFMLLKNIRSIKLDDGSYILSEITKEQKLIFEAFNLTVPSSPGYNF